MYNDYGGFMKTIDSNIKNEYVINKSKFIACLFKVNTINEVNDYLELIKSEYKDATHYCYSYIIDNVKRFNDDGEPGGTAGMPILNVLESNNLNYILCIVVRYFGGIKLGAGGLVRAYTKSVTLALENCNIIDIKEGYKIELIFDYENSKVIDILLKNEIILSKEFNDVIKYEIIVNKEHYDVISKLEIGCIRVSIMDLIKY